MSPPDMKSADVPQDSQSDILTSSQSQEIDGPYNPETPTKAKVPIRSIITLVVLVYINLLNYMDRQTVAGVLPQIQSYFDIENSKASLLQTVFVCAYMVFAPLFGYLGDRVSRKYVMAVGILLWTVFTFVGSLMGPNHYWWFLILRALVGIGEASYSTVAPTIIADLFVGDQRTKALSLFYLAIPAGGGLGYIVGSQVAALMGNKWQWALRVTPALGIAAVLLTLIAVHEPKRGVIEVAPAAANVDDLSESIVIENRSGYIFDLKEIAKVKSFVWATMGFTCASFVIGAFAFWTPEFALYSEQVSGHKNATEQDVSFVFGIITVVAGIVGCAVGAEWARRWRMKNEKADPLVCGIGVLCSAPFMFFALWLASQRMIAMWILLGVGETLLFMNWVPNGDILLYVIGPSRRSTAEAVQILIIHILGDAISPFLVGYISDAITQGSTDVVEKQKGLLYALFICPFICVLGGLCYVVTSIYIANDKRNALEEATVTVVANPQANLESYPNSQHSLPGVTTFPDPYDREDAYSSDEEDPRVDISDTQAIVTDGRERNKSPSSLVI